MCNFFSCIVDKNKKVYWREGIDNHHELVDIFGLKDNTDNQQKMLIARVEITPPNNDYRAELEDWHFNVDERIKPEWFSPAHEKVCMEALKKCLDNVLIIDQETKEIKDKKGLILVNSRVDVIKNVKIREMRARSQVGVMMDRSQVGEMWESSQVGEMMGSSQVGVMMDRSQVGVMRARSQVGVMRDRSQVGVMRDRSQVGVMRDRSQVGEMRARSQVGVMRDRSQVGEMWDSSQVGEMWDSSQVGEMWDSSQVGEMMESSQVGEMRDSSQVTVLSKKVKYLLEEKSIVIDKTESKTKIIVDKKHKIKIEKQ